MAAKTMCFVLNGPTDGIVPTLLDMLPPFCWCPCSLFAGATASGLSFGKGLGGRRDLAGYGGGLNGGLAAGMASSGGHRPCPRHHILIGCRNLPTDHELALLLSLDGFEFHFALGHTVKIAAREIAATKHRPYGIKYSLTLHDPSGRRIYGMDNAHGIRRRTEYDHRHVHGARKALPYQYRGPAKLLEDFYREVERMMRERGAR